MTSWGVTYYLFSFLFMSQIMFLGRFGLGWMVSQEIGLYIRCILFTREGGVQGAWFGLDFIFQGLNACAIIIFFLISMILLRLPPPCWRPSGVPCNHETCVMCYDPSRGRRRSLYLSCLHNTCSACSLTFAKDASTVVHITAFPVSREAPLEERQHPVSLSHTRNDYSPGSY